MTKLSRRQLLILAGAAPLGCRAGLFNARANPPAVSYSCAASAAAGSRDGGFFVAGFSTAGEVVFQQPLPTRGHDIAVHPQRTMIAVCARRPGRFIQLRDAQTGALRQQLDSPPGHHFYGHAVFSADGRFLLATENHYRSQRGMLAIYQREASGRWQRIEQFYTDNIGPHELCLMPGGDEVVIANGGIATHPQRDREKLNLDTMSPSLVYMNWRSGSILESVALPDSHLSIRHLDVSSQGDVVIGCQYQRYVVGQSMPPLVYRHRRGSALQPLPCDELTLRRMHGYTASVAFNRQGDGVAVTCPRGNLIVAWPLTPEAKQPGVLALRDVAGLARSAEHFIATTGDGQWLQLSLELAVVKHRRHRRAHWDNHLAIA